MAMILYQQKTAVTRFGKKKRKKKIELNKNKIRKQ